MAKTSHSGGSVPEVVSYRLPDDDPLHPDRQREATAAAKTVLEAEAARAGVAVGDLRRVQAESGADSPWRLAAAARNKAQAELQDEADRRGVPLDQLRRVQAEESPDSPDRAATLARLAAAARLGDG